MYDFSEFVGNAPISEPYILVYILGRDISGSGVKVINAIKEKYGAMKVVGILTSSGFSTSSLFSDVVITDASPSEWVNYFAHASFVYTDSFHGVMFSMKFHKDFICYILEGCRKSRLVDVQQTYGLSNLVFDAREAESIIRSGYAHPDYSLIVQKESEIIEKSRLYLTHALANK